MDATQNALSRALARSAPSSKQQAVPEHDLLALLSPVDRAELRTMPMRELEAELEWVGCTVADIEDRLAGENIWQLSEEGATFAEWGLRLESRGEILRAEIMRRMRLKQPLRGPLYSRQVIFDLKQRVDLPLFIVSIHSGTQLKRSGSHYAGLCPFHVEKTPSLHVWSDHYWCFSCSIHGDVFDWLLSHPAGMVRSWIEAVEYVAKHVGVALPKPEERRTVLGAYSA